MIYSYYKTIFILLSTITVFFTEIFIFFGGFAYFFGADTNAIVNIGFCLSILMLSIWILTIIILKTESEYSNLSEPERSRIEGYRTSPYWRYLDMHQSYGVQFLRFCLFLK